MARVALGSSAVNRALSVFPQSAPIECSTIVNSETGVLSTLTVGTPTGAAKIGGM